eukprot:11481647-Alexandrium_andersonii.AAC.1
MAADMVERGVCDFGIAGEVTRRPPLRSAACAEAPPGVGARARAGGPRARVEWHPRESRNAQ